MTGPKDPLVGPLVKLRIASAGTAFRHCRRAGEPTSCVHPTADAKVLKTVKLYSGIADTAAPENMIPARKGASVELCRAMAKDTDTAPADCP